MATTKSIAPIFILLNLAMFTFVSTNAACPNLSVCMNIASNLVNVQIGSQATSNCCQLIGGLVGLDATACLCTSLQTTLLGSLLASVLNLTSGLPLVGGILGGILGGLGNLPLMGSLTPDILNQEILALVNACGVNATNFKCST